MSNYRLYDNTRISAYRRCPRFYFYRHVKHWEVDAKRIPLIFGECWHRAMDMVWRELIEGLDLQTVVEDAYAEFVDAWVQQGMPHPREIDYELEKELSPRTPGRAQEMLIAYAAKRQQSLQSGDFELLACEKPFAVPLDPEVDNLFYIGKMDKVVKRRGKHGVIEHKTTTAYKKTDSENKIRTTFVDSFSPNSQVDGYLYAMHMMFPGDVFGVWVDASLVHKTEESFMFIPVERQLAQLDAWLWETRSVIDQIEANKDALAGISASDKYMSAFPKNTNSCFDFNSACPYLELCKAWPNPAGKPLPPGFIEEEWDPLKHIGTLPEEVKNG